MADLEKIVKLIFEGDGTGLSREMALVSRDFDNFSRDVQNATAPLGDFGVKVAKAEAALIALGVAGLVYAVNEFKNFEDVMLKVRGVIGANSDEYARLTELTKDLGENTRYTAAEAAQGLEFLALAGFDVEDAIGALPQVLNLAQASALDLGRAADIVTNIMAGYGIGVDGLADANDVLTATFTNSNTSLDQLGQAFKMVGPVAKSLGLDLDETAAILGTLGNAGYQAEMGGTALRNILLALVAPAGNFSKLTKELGVDTQELGVDLASSANALKSLGVNVKDANGELLPFTDIMDQMKTGLEKIQDPADRTAILIEVFGKRGGPQMAALLEQGSDAVGGLQDKIQSLGGVTKDIADQMESGIGGALRAFRSAFQSVAIEIGESVSGDIAPAIGGFTEIFRTLSDEIDTGTFDPILNAIGEFGADTAELLESIAQNLSEALEGVDFSGLVESFKGLGAEVGEAIDALFGGDLDLSTVAGLEDAIQRVVNALTGITNFTTGFIDGLKPILITVGEVAQSFNEMDAEGQVLAGNVSGWAQSVNTLFSSLDTLKSALVAIAGITGLSSVVNSITLFAAVKPDSFKAVASSLSGMASSITQLIGAAAGLVGAGAIGWQIGTWLNSFDVVQDTAQGFAEWTDKLINWTGNADSANEQGQELTKTIKEIRTEALQGALLEVGIEFTGNETFEELQAKYNAFQNNDPIQITADAEQAGQTLADLGLTAKELEAIELQFEQGSYDKFSQQFKEVSETEFEVVGHYANGDEILMEIEESIPAEKKIEVKPTVSEQAKMDLERDLANIEASAENLQTAMEWSAKVDIAEIEAAAKIGEAAFDNIGDSVVAVASGVADMFSALAGGMDGLSQSEKWKMFDILEDQQAAQEELINAQVALTKAQTEYMNLKNEKLESGETADINIDTTGLEPALEMVMWQIIEKVQIRANENAQEFLLGMPS
jgi:TP901 family phage tail tape measure protein